VAGTGGPPVYRSPYLSTSANTPADHGSSVPKAHYSNAMAAAYLASYRGTA